ncbi:MAG: MerR family transcriptional regulator [Pseudomonadota bacterium]|nr:MerR family transcriptional regulator [Pseudomonadota bacterium]
MAIAEIEDGTTSRKSAFAFRTISEVSKALQVPTHVLRFWESKFSSIKPLKRGGGRRYYRPEDLDLLRQIKSLLYDDGYTIKGVQKLLRDQSKEVPERIKTLSPAEILRDPLNKEDLTGSKKDQIEEIVDELEELRDYLRSS